MWSVWNETVALAQTSTKLLTAKALGAAGYTDMADKMEDDAKKELKDCEENGIIAAPALINKAMGNDEEASRIATKSIKSTEDVLDAAPVVGHVKGLCHYMAGDEEHGKKCMIDATRSGLVYGVNVVTGGLVNSQAGEAFDQVVTSITGKP